VATLLGQDREPDSELPLARQLRFDGGSPGMNLVATLGRRGSGTPAERLSSVGRLAQWLEGNGLPRVALGERDLAAARALRDCAYPVLTALAEGHRPPREALAELGDLAARPLAGPRLRVSRGRAPVWAPPAVTFDAVLTELARDLARIAVEHADELRVCDADSCRMVYLDASRGRRRRWCSMGRCGNSAKVARHRAKTAKAGQAGQRGQAGRVTA